MFTQGALNLFVFGIKDRSPILELDRLDERKEVLG